MKVIVISGTHSGVGKTSLATGVMQALRCAALQHGSGTAAAAAGIISQAKTNKACLQRYGCRLATYR